MRRLFIVAFALAAVGEGWFLSGNGAPKESRPPLAPDQEKAVDDALDAYIGHLKSLDKSLDTVRLEFTAVSTYAVASTGKEHRREEHRGVLTFKKPGMQRNETFKDGRLSSVMTVDRSGKCVYHSVESNKTIIHENSKGLLKGFGVERDPVPFYYYPHVFAFYPDLAERRDSLKKMAVAVESGECSGISCRVITFKGLGTKYSRSSERSRLWIGPDGAPVRSLYEDDRQDGPTDSMYLYTGDTLFTSVRTGVEAPDSLFTFTPPEGGRVLTEEDLLDPAMLLLPKGGAAPEIACVDLGGDPVRLSDFRGKLVLLNFWNFG